MPFMIVQSNIHTSSRRVPPFSARFEGRRRDTNSPKEEERPFFLDWVSMATVDCGILTKMYEWKELILNKIKE